MKLRTLALIGTMAALAACDSGSSGTYGAAPPGPPTATVAPKAPAPAPAPAEAEEAVDPAQEIIYEARDKSKDGKIVGTVKFTGTAPDMPQIDMKKTEAVCAAKHEKPVKKETVIVNANGTLKNVFVYIVKGAKDIKVKTPTEPVEINQEGCVYKPHVLGMMAGQPMRIRSSDAGVLHNIHSWPVDNDGFNFSQSGVGEDILTTTSKYKTFSKQEVMVWIKCDIHDWMGAWVGVRNNPFFAVTGDDGTYTISGVPPGKYELVAWHEFYGNKRASPKPTEPLRSKEIEVTPGQSVTLDFEFKG
jgi:hypothetical protein